MAETERDNSYCNETIKSVVIKLAIIPAIILSQVGDASRRTITNRNLCLIDPAMTARLQNVYASLAKSQPGLITRASKGKARLFRGLLRIESLPENMLNLLKNILFNSNLLSILCSISFPFITRTCAMFR